MLLGLSIEKFTK